MRLHAMQCARDESVVDFMCQCANQFFSNGASEPVLAYPTRRGRVSVFACSESDHWVVFFRAIFEQDPDRFYRSSREFDQAQQSLRGESLGWALTRFGGQLFLSLRWANDIIVYKVPVQLRKSMIAMAVRHKCYMDCSFIAEGRAGGFYQMPQQLAVELAS